MNIKNNQRTKETSQHIQEVVNQLLQNKPIAKITVQEICANAQINRSTFYKHYDNVYHVVETIKQELAEQIQVFFIEDCSENSWGLSNTCFDNLFGFILEHIDFYKACIQNANTENIIDFPLFVFCENQLQHLAEKKGIKSQLQFSYHIEYFMSGLNAIIRHWIHLGCKETPDELATYIRQEYKNTLT